MFAMQSGRVQCVNCTCDDKPTTRVVAVTIPDVCGMFCVVVDLSTLQSTFVHSNTEYDTLFPPSYIIYIYISWCIL